MNTITIDLDQVNQFVQDGGKLVFDPLAEKSLIRLLQLQDLLSKKIDEVKKNIALAGQSIDPNFKGVIGSNIKATYRLYGEKYALDEDSEEGRQYCVETSKVKIDSKKVDEYVSKKGEVPSGILLRPRAPVISLQPLNGSKEEVSDILLTADDVE